MFRHVPTTHLVPSHRMGGRLCDSIYSFSMSRTSPRASPGATPPSTTSSTFCTQHAHQVLPHGPCLRGKSLRPSAFFPPSTSQKTLQVESRNPTYTETRSVVRLASPEPHVFVEQWVQRSQALGGIPPPTVNFFSAIGLGHRVSSSSSTPSTSQIGSSNPYRQGIRPLTIPAPPLKLLVLSESPLALQLRLPGLLTTPPLDSKQDSAPH